MAMDTTTATPRTIGARNAAPRKRAAPRRAVSGDVVDTREPAAVERAVVARSTQRHQTVTEQAIQDVAARTDTPLAERLAAIQALWMAPRPTS